MALPKPDYATKNMKLVGYSDLAAAATACRSWCTTATPISGTSFPRAFRSRRRARPEEPEGGELHRRAAQHLDAASAGARRPAARHPQQGHVRAGRDGRREELLQGQGRRATPRPSRACATGRRAWPSTTSQSPATRSRSASCRSKAPACIGSGTSAGAGPMPRRCSTVSPTTS